MFLPNKFYSRTSGTPFDKSSDRYFYRDDKNTLDLYKEKVRELETKKSPAKEDIEKLTNIEI